MNIKFIGTGSMLSNDNQACYLINDNVMIDLPNGTVKVLKRINKLSTVKYVFITHIHGDHYFDLPFLLLDKLKRNEEITIYASRWCMPRIKWLIKMAFPREYFKILFAKHIHFVTNKHEVIIDDMKFNRFKVVHGKMKPAFGYTVNYNNKVVTFTGDACLNKAIYEKANESDYMICDCTMQEGNVKHMGINNIKELLENDKLTIIPSHMSPKAKEGLLKLKNKNLLIKEDLEDLKI